MESENQIPVRTRLMVGAGILLFGMALAGRFHPGAVLFAPAFPMGLAAFQAGSENAEVFIALSYVIYAGFLAAFLAIRNPIAFRLTCGAFLLLVLITVGCWRVHDGLNFM